MGLMNQLPLSPRDGPTNSHRLTGEDEELGREGQVKLLLLTAQGSAPSFASSIIPRFKKKSQVNFASPLHFTF